MFPCLGAVTAQLRDHRAQRADQIECDFVGDQHVHVLLGEGEVVSERNASCRRPPRRGDARRDRAAQAA